MSDLTQLSDTELHEGYRAYSAEINRRHELRRIPQEISNLAQQGHDIGLEESTMIDAVTNQIGYSLEIDEPQE